MQYWSELEQGCSVPSFLSVTVHVHCADARSQNLHFDDSSVPIPDLASLDPCPVEMSQNYQINFFNSSNCIDLLHIDLIILTFFSKFTSCSSIAKR
jgi:hypothetical protein